MLIEDLLMLQQKPWKYLKAIQSGSISKDAYLYTKITEYFNSNYSGWMV